MQVRELDVVSIHPHPEIMPGMDLKHILAALSGQIGGWSWCVRGLDWLGEGGESLCDAVESAGPGGLWIDSEALVEQASGIHQTIEGDFLAFAPGLAIEQLKPSDLDLSRFPESPAIFAIIAVDGCYFDVYSKDRDLIGRLNQALPGLREEDTTRYFRAGS